MNVLVYELSGPEDTSQLPPPQSTVQLRQTASISLSVSVCKCPNPDLPEVSTGFSNSGPNPHQPGKNQWQDYLYSNTWFVPTCCPGWGSAGHAYAAKRFGVTLLPHGNVVPTSLGPHGSELPFHGGADGVDTSQSPPSSQRKADSAQLGP